MQRRTFLQFLSGAALAAGEARRALAAAGGGIKLGIDVYSIRDLRWSTMRLFEYAAGLKLDAVQLGGRELFENVEPAYLAKVRAYAERNGITIDAGIGAICPTTKSWNPREGDPGEYVLRGLRVSRALGSTCMRVYAGSIADRGGPLPVEAHMESTIKVLRGIRQQALNTGVKVAIENHQDFEAWELKTVIEESGRDFVAACLDTGNPMWVLEDPFVTLETLAPYTVTTHIRDSAVYEHPRGAAFQWVALGDGSVDFKRFTARFRELCPQAAMQMEIITGRPPQVLPYLEDGYWKAFPKKRASEFARFLALVKSGRPYMGPMMIGGPGKQPPEFQAALREQQRLDLERSLEYARKSLGVGGRGQG